MVVSNHILAVIAFLVLVGVLAVLVALAHGRQRRFDSEKDQRRPLGHNAYLGGVLDPAGSPADTVAAAATAAFAALENLATVAAAAVAPPAAAAAVAPPAAAAAVAPGPSQPLVAADSATYAATPFQQMDMGDGVVAYYVECTGLPVTDGFDPAAKTYFVFEKLTGTRRNYLHWWKYVDAQEKIADERELQITEGTVALMRTLELTRSCSDKYDMWIAYASNKKPTTIAERVELFDYTRGVASDATGIEMVFSVLVDREAPVTTHSGIFRTYEYWKQLTGEIKDKYVQRNYIDKGRKLTRKYHHTAVGHPGLSALLHGFAAAAARHVYSHLGDYDGSVMVTRPAAEMGKIMRKTLRPGEYTVGSPDERGSAKVQERAKLYANPSGSNVDIESFSPKVYEPALGQIYTPFFVERIDRNTGKRTWTFGDNTYNAPEWMQKRGRNNRCDHEFASFQAQDDSALEYTIRLSALARGWSPPN